MDFGKKILGKLGWKEGQGLGKRSDGLVKPIKANLKFDNLGFGADLAASDFNNHWWDRVYAEASKNVAIEEDTTKDGKTQLNLKRVSDDVEITTNSYSIKKLKKIKHTNGATSSYDNFLKSATLTNEYKEVEDTEKMDVGQIAFTSSHKQLSDEELFRACGGRTAHKGARHGLRLSGKLSRIEKQDQELLAKMQLIKQNGSEESRSNSKSKEKLVVAEEEDLGKSTKIECDLERGSACRVENDENPLTSSEPKKKKKKKKHSKDEESIDVAAQPTEISKKKKKLKTQ